MLTPRRLIAVTSIAALFAVVALIFLWPHESATTAAPKSPTFPAYTVSVFAGSGEAGLRDGPGSDAQFGEPRGLAVDAGGNVYVLEFGNACLRRITPDGTVSTLRSTRDPDLAKAGSCEVTALWGPPSVVVTDSSIFTLHGLGSLRGFDKASHEPTGVVANVKDLPKILALGPTVWTFAVARDGSFVLPDMSGSRILRVRDGIATTIAGTRGPGYRDGPVAVAEFSAPVGVAVGRDGSAYISDSGNHVIRRISPDGFVTTVAGTTAIAKSDGPALQAAFYRPGALVVDAEDNLWILDDGDVRVLSHGHVFTVAEGLKTRDFPGIAVGPNGTVYVAASGANQIVQLTRVP